MIGQPVRSEQQHFVPKALLRRGQIIFLIPHVALKIGGDMANLHVILQR
jgi:hypothetical protein